MSAIGIRREDKNRWEARVPLIPEDVRRLIQEHGVAFRVQPSAIRTFADSAYADAGAEVDEDLEACRVIMGVKEIPPQLLATAKTYVFFSHTIKGQPGNMPMLRRLMELKCQLIDYERIVDAQDRRLVFFGQYAGLAGMIDALWALGQRLEQEGVDNPFAAVRQAHHYDSLEQARSDIRTVGQRIRDTGLPSVCRPFICGFAGYGQVSQGAQQIFDLLPVKDITPDDLGAISPASDTCFKVVFHERHMVRRTEPAAPFELQEYYDHPQRYRGRFSDHLPHLTMLVNCIYWEPKYPRLVTLETLKALYGGAKQPMLRVIADISCDIGGSVECTVRSTEPGSPVYVYEPGSATARDGVAGHGPVILAVDNLPCELPAESSAHFSRAVRPFIPHLAGADFAAPLADSGLPPELAGAAILYHGALTEPYRYLEQYLS